MFADINLILLKNIGNYHKYIYYIILIGKI